MHSLHTCWIHAAHTLRCLDPQRLSAPSLTLSATPCTRAHLCTPAHPHTPVHLCRGDGAAGEAAASVVALRAQLAGQADQTVATLRESLAALGVSVDGIGGVGGDADGAEAAAALQAGLILTLALAMAQLHQRPHPDPYPHLTLHFTPPLTPHLIPHLELDPHPTLGRHSSRVVRRPRSWRSAPRWRSLSNLPYPPSPNSNPQLQPQPCCSCPSSNPSPGPSPAPIRTQAADIAPGALSAIGSGTGGLQQAADR